VTSHIPEKGQVMIRYFGPYANAHRGKVRRTFSHKGQLEMAEKYGTSFYLYDIIALIHGWYT
jgi:hypothetical protein